MARLAPFSALLLLALAAGCNREAPPAPQAQADAAPQAPSTAGAVDESQKGKRLPDVEIQDPSDTAVTIAKVAGGKPILVNLWATWCVPCVKELPTLDALAAREAGKLVVLTVSEDLQGRKVVAPFFQKHGYKALKPYTDTSNALMLKLKEVGLPATILYDADGKELWRVRGDMEWDSAKARALLAQAGV